VLVTHISIFCNRLEKDYDKWGVERKDLQELEMKCLNDGDFVKAERVRLKIHFMERE